MRSSIAVLAATAIAIALPERVAGASQGATEPRIALTPLLTALQFVPSPHFVAHAGGFHAGMRWQITPFLYSFGVDPRLSPLRSLVVEPVVRHAGSIELFVSPEYLAVPASAASRWLLRVGLRSYFPVLHRGEYLSISAGASAFHFQGRAGAAGEVGVYTLSGLVGLQVTYSPSPALHGALFTLSLRFL